MQGSHQPSPIPPFAGRLGARLTLNGQPHDGSRYWAWWFTHYGEEALEIARAFVADLPDGILPSRPAGSSREVGSRAKSPVGRTPSPVELVSATNRQREG